MASTRVIEQDFDTIRALLARHRPGESIRLAVTEYAAVFTEKGAIDDYIGTLGAALFGADALRVFAQADDLLMATNDADGHATGTLRWQSVDIAPGLLPLGFIVPAHSISVLALRLFNN